MLFRKRSISVSIILILLFLVFCLPTSADHKEEVGHETVRVGYFLSDGFQEISEVGDYSGYGYDYLQVIAQHTGWEYEYVISTYAQALQMLADGEIDLLGSLQYSEERDKVFDYADIQSGVSSACLFTLEEDTRLAYDDFEAFDGMTVGLLATSARNTMLSHFCQDHGFSVNTLSFTTQEELNSALEAGTVDAILLSDVRRMPNMRIIAQYDPLPYYYAVTAGNTELLDALNEAIQEIKALDPFFDTQLYQKYYDFSDDVAPVFTNEESEYIHDHDVITVAYDPNYRPFEYRNQNGVFDGVMADIFKLISDQTGLRFSFIAGDDLTESVELLKNGQAQVFASVMQDHSWAERQHAFLTSSFYNMSIEHFCMVHVENPKIVALPRGLFSRNAIEVISENADVLFFDTVSDCLDAVAAGQADFTAIGTDVAEYYVQGTHYERFRFRNLIDVNETLSMAVSRDEPILLSILNKALTSISDREIEHLIFENTIGETQPSLGRLISNYPIPSVSVMAGIFLLTLAAFIMVVRAKQKQGEAIEELRFRAEKDLLTGIDNENSFEVKTGKLLQEHPEQKYLIIRFDVERFKAINDLWGFDTGNQLLCFIANYMDKFVQEHGGTCCRMYADNYAACIPYSEENIADMLDLTKQAVGKSKIDAEVIIHFGLYVVDEPELPIYQMLDRARMAQATIKGNVVQPLAYYQDAYRKRMLLEQHISGQAGEAFEKKQFAIYLQPQFEYSSNKIVGAEALVRWIHPTEGMISPGVFIPIFEKNGSISKLDEYVWEQICETIQRWIKDGLELVPLSVNISRFDMLDEKLPEKILALTQKHAIPADMLRLEITESAFMDDSDQLLKTVAALREYGFIVEMDDFGSGYSSLNTLKEVVFDVLKLDMKFLSGSSDDGRGEKVILSIVNMAHELGLTTIAEGVETQEQADFLGSIGCEVIQGFFYARPMPVSDFEKLVSEKADI